MLFKEPTKQMGYRLPVSLFARIDKYAAQLARQNPGVYVSKSDAVRVLLIKGLDEAEAEAKPAGKAKR